MCPEQSSASDGFRKGSIQIKISLSQTEPGQESVPRKNLIKKKYFLTRTSYLGSLKDKVSLKLLKQSSQVYSVRTPLQFLTRVVKLKGGSDFVLFSVKLFFVTHPSLEIGSRRIVSFLKRGCSGTQISTKKENQQGNRKPAKI